MWGQNKKGQLGLDSNDAVDTPSLVIVHLGCFSGADAWWVAAGLQVRNLTQLVVVQIACGAEHTVVRTDTGVIQS